MLPDDNAPTVPNPPVPRPGQPVVPSAPPAPPVINATGKAPIWQVARPQTPADAGAGATVGSFSLGFGIALVVLALMALVLGIALNINGQKGGNLGEVATSTPVPSPTQNVLTPTATALPPIDNTTATNLVTQFYLDISSQNVQNAYNLLSDSYQSHQTIQEFQQQWQNTQQVTVDPSSIMVTPDAANTVKVMLTYTQVTNTNPPTSTQVNATLKVGYEHNNPRILSIDTQPVPTTPTPQPSPSPSPSPTDTPMPTDTGTPTATTPTAGTPTPGTTPNP